MARGTITGTVVRKAMLLRPTNKKVGRGSRDKEADRSWSPDCFREVGKKHKRKMGREKDLMGMGLR